MFLSGPRQTVILLPTALQRGVMLPSYLRMSSETSEIKSKKEYENPVPPCMQKGVVSNQGNLSATREI